MKHTYQSVLSYMRALLVLYKNDAWVLLLYAVVSGFIALMMPVTVQALVSSVSFTAMMQPVVVLAAALFVALAFQGVMGVLQYKTVEVLQQRIFVRLGYRASRNPELMSLESSKKQRLAFQFLEISSIQKSVSFLLMDGISVVMQACVGFILLASYHPALFVLGASVLFFAVCIVVGFARSGVETAIEESKEKYRFVHWLGENNSTQAADEDVYALFASFLKSRQKHFSVVLKQLVSSYVLQALMSVGLLLVGGYWVIQAELSLGQLVAAEVVLAGVLTSLTKLGKHLESFYDLSSSLYKIHDVVPVEDDAQGHAFENLCVTYPKVSFKTAAVRVVSVASFVTVAGLVCIKWQQTAYAKGRVMSFAAQDRQQTIDAPIEGQVVHWYVHEGSFVKKGDPIVDLSDTDPLMLSRLTRERDAIVDRIKAGRERAAGLEVRIDSVRKARDNAILAASSRVKMAHQREKAALQAREAAQASLTTSKINKERSQTMFAEGLISKRQLELAELDFTRSETEYLRAQASLDAAKEELNALESDQIKIDNDGRASIGDASASVAIAEAEIASASAELTRVEVRLARQSSQLVRAPKDGTVLRILSNAQGTDIVKAGEHLALFVPASDDRTVELWVDGNDVPLVRVGQHVRLQFEGWPAVQFSGWPSVAVGTFGGTVALIDSALNEDGQLRVLVAKDKNETWPSLDYLRQGVRANGWIQFARVRLGYELWRRFNAFPPSLPQKDVGAAKKDAPSKPSKGS